MTKFFHFLDSFEINVFSKCVLKGRLIARVTFLYFHVLGDCSVDGKYRAVL